MGCGGGCKDGACGGGCTGCGSADVGAKIPSAKDGSKRRDRARRSDFEKHRHLYDVRDPRVRDPDVPALALLRSALVGLDRAADTELERAPAPRARPGLATVVLVPDPARAISPYHGAMCGTGLGKDGKHPREPLVAASNIKPGRSQIEPGRSVVLLRNFALPVPDDGNFFPVLMEAVHAMPHGDNGRVRPCRPGILPDPKGVVLRPLRRRRPKWRDADIESIHEKRTRPGASCTAETTSGDRVGFELAAPLRRTLPPDHDERGEWLELIDPRADESGIGRLLAQYRLAAGLFL